MGSTKQASFYLPGSNSMLLAPETYPLMAIFEKWSCLREAELRSIIDFFSSPSPSDNISSDGRTNLPKLESSPLLNFELLNATGLCSCPILFVPGELLLRTRIDREYGKTVAKDTMRTASATNRVPCEQHQAVLHPGLAQHHENRRP
jgi:hypothetical protein